MRKTVPKTYGFTLIEVMVVIALLGIILAIAMPGFGQMLARARITAELDDLNVSLAYARSEAIKQGLNVVVCPSITVGAATPTCAAQTAWATGWIVVATTGSCDTTTGMVLRQKDAFSSTDTATYTPINAANNNVCFNRFGLASSGYTGSFVFSDGSHAKRCLSLSATGIGQVVNAGDSDAAGVTCQ